MKVLELHYLIVFLTIFLLPGYFFVFSNSSLDLFQDTNNLTYLDMPIQKKVSSDSLFFEKNGFAIEPLYSYEIQARVISKKKYSFDKGSQISPYDLVLGWEDMADLDVLGNISFSQSNRRYTWYTKSPPISLRDIAISSANVHIIPINDSIEDVFSDVNMYDIITIKGYLVKVKKSEGSNWFEWKSSTTRFDVGNGACELIYVESVKIE